MSVEEEEVSRGRLVPDPIPTEPLRLETTFAFCKATRRKERTAGLQFRGEPPSEAQFIFKALSSLSAAERKGLRKIKVVQANRKDLIPEWLHSFSWFDQERPFHN